MPEPKQADDDELSRLWDARIAGMKPILGEPSDETFHAPIPFYLGGFADVFLFPHFVPGMTYTTFDLTGWDMGQKPNSLGHYELMICVREELDQAAEMIARLSRSTCESKLEPGETMDIGEFLGDRSIRALLFTHPTEEPAQFEVLGQRCGLLLCVGITAKELAFKHRHGSDELLALLKDQGVFPYTVPDRPSEELPSGGSFLGRLFGR